MPPGVVDIHGTDFRAIAGDIKSALGIADEALFNRCGPR